MLNLLLPVMVLMTAPASAQLPAAPDTASQAVIVTTGEAVLQRAPDRAWVTIAAENRARTPGEAQRANAEAMSAVTERIKAAGIPSDAVQTAGYELQPEFDYANGRQTLRDYVARNRLEVRVEPLERLGQIIGAAVGSGATSVSGIRFDLKDRDSAEREALSRAVADAVARGQAAAAGAHVTVDRVMRIEEQRDVAIPQPRPVAMMARQTVEATPAVPIEAGQIEIRARVVVTTTIK